MHIDSFKNAGCNFTFDTPFGDVTVGKEYFGVAVEGSTQVSFVDDTGKRSTTDPSWCVYIRSDSAIPAIETESETEKDEVKTRRIVPTEEQPAFSLFSSVENRVPFKSQFDVQVGGGHYKGRSIQPIQYIIANKLDFSQGNIIKYCTRFRDKNGAEDLKKVIHYSQFLLETEYNVLSKVEYQNGKET